MTKPRAPIAMNSGAASGAAAPSACGAGRSAPPTRPRPPGVQHEGMTGRLLLPEGARDALARHQLHDLLTVEHPTAPCPGLVLPCHVGDTLGMPGREVVQLGAIDLHVVEFPRPGIVAHQFPFADAYRGVAFVLP